MTDSPIHVLRALSLGLCLRRISILLLLSQEEMGIMRLTRATGQYRQLITNDLRALIDKKLVAECDKRGRIKYYTISPYGAKVLQLLTFPLELTAVIKS